MRANMLALLLRPEGISRAEALATFGCPTRVTNLIDGLSACNGYRVVCGDDERFRTTGPLAPALTQNGRLLAELRCGPISVDEVASALHVSKMAVQRTIGNLRTAGHTITALGDGRFALNDAHAPVNYAPVVVGAPAACE